MNNTQKIIVAILVYLISGLIGYTVASFISGPSAKSSGNGQPASAYSSGAQSSGTQSSGRASSSTNIVSSPVPVSQSNVSDVPVTTTDSQPLEGDLHDILADNELRPGLVNPTSSIMITSVSSPRYNDASRSYSFSVSADGSVREFVLLNESKDFVMSSSDGFFASVPATSSGVYYVYASGIGGERSDDHAILGCVFKVQKVTASELNQVLNSGDSNAAINANFRNRIAPGCRFVFVGRDESEGDAPISYNDILMRIHLGTWASVSVQSVSYNDADQVSKAVIGVNY